MIHTFWWRSITSFYLWLLPTLLIFRSLHHDHFSVCWKQIQENLVLVLSWFVKINVISIIFVLEYYKVSTLYSKMRKLMYVLKWPSGYRTQFFQHSYVLLKRHSAIGFGYFVTTHWIHHSSTMILKRVRWEYTFLSETILCFHWCWMYYMNRKIFAVWKIS